MTLLPKLLKASHKDFAKNLVIKYYNSFGLRLLSRSMARKMPQAADTLVLFSTGFSPTRRTDRGQTSAKLYYWDHLHGLVAHELVKIGCRVGFIYKNGVFDRSLPSIEHDGKKVTGVLSLRHRLRSIESDNPQEASLSTNLDLSARVATVDGLDVFPFLESNLRGYYRIYNIDFDNKEVRFAASQIMESIKTAVSHFNIILKYARSNNVRVKIIGREISYVPSSIFRELCQMQGGGLIEYVDFDRYYMHYFGRSSRDSYVALINCTKCGVEHRGRLTNSEWLRLKDDRSLLSEGRAGIEYVKRKNLRASSSFAGKKPELMALKKAQDEGKRIFVLFGHLFYDTGIYDSSEAYADMCSWLRDTVDTFANSNDILVIKPHPSEERPDEPRKTPHETVGQFLAELGPVPDNIVVLPPRAITLSELMPFIDVGLIWRSSVALELTLADIPSVIAGDPNYSVLPLRFANSRSAYLELIEDSKNLRVTEEQVDAVKRYFAWLYARHHTLLPQIMYSRSLDAHFWSFRALLRYLTRGDKAVSEVARKIVAPAVGESGHQSVRLDLQKRMSISSNA